MQHSKNFERVKNYYDTGLWSIVKVRNAVVKGWITDAEFQEITGESLSEIEYDLANGRCVYCHKALDSDGSCTNKKCEANK